MKAAVELIHSVPARKPKIEIGSRWTGKREVHYDTLAGTYAEAKPVLGDFELMLQKALVPALRVKIRKPEDIRQKQ